MQAAGAGSIKVRAWMPGWLTMAAMGPPPTMKSTSSSSTSCRQGTGRVSDGSGGNSAFPACIQGLLGGGHLNGLWPCQRAAGARSPWGRVQDAACTLRKTQAARSKYELQAAPARDGHV